MNTPSPPLSPNGKKVDDVIKHRSETHLQRLSPSRQPSRNSTKCLQRNCMLVLIGILLICSVILSLTIGHYHHNQIAEEILSITSSSSLQIKLRDFLGDANENSEKSRREGTNNEPSRRKETNNEKSRDKKREIIDSYHERSIFESIIERVKWTKEQCNNIPSNQRNSVKKSLKAATDLPMLPEGGVAPALEKWLKKNPPSSTNNDYPTCYLPPPKSCNVTTYTLVIMSHTTERLQTFMDPLSPMVDSWPGLTEIIIVWNSPRENLADVEKITDGNQRKYAAQLLQWDGDASHPLRIFFSLENGLANNLLNRYHPKLKPKNEVVMYFDDDGPFWSRESMVYGGLELWKRNSNVQVGAFPRNIRFLSDRMKKLETTNLQQSIDIVVKDVHSYSGESHATFTPVCRNVTGDHVEYNYFSFPDFAGHVLLPSGTFLHRNFLCFIWHPAFEELRQWVVTHKTMPDDMTVSTLVSHLSGRAPRTFPREVSTAKRRLSSVDVKDPMLLQNEHIVSRGLLQSPKPDQSHRRLLWKQKNWGGMREEAINSILGYFGSIHPGTVGWCAGTSYMKKNNRGVPFVCHPEKPTLDLLPWLTEGGIGSTQCPFDPDIIKQSLVFAKKEDPSLEFDDFCGECKYKGMGITCKTRMQYLIDTYSDTPLKAKTAVIKEEAACEKKR